MIEKISESEASDYNFGACCSVIDFSCLTRSTYQHIRFAKRFRCENCSIECAWSAELTGTHKLRTSESRTTTLIIPNGNFHNNRILGSLHALIGYHHICNLWNNSMVSLCNYRYVFVYLIPY